jgi:hypothetical protein
MRCLIRPPDGDRRLFEIAMAQQHLDGAQVGPGFQQMRGKAMTQSVRMDFFLLSELLVRAGNTSHRRPWLHGRAKYLSSSRGEDPASFAG